MACVGARSSNWDAKTTWAVAPTGIIRAATMTTVKSKVLAARADPGNQKGVEGADVAVFQERRAAGVRVSAGEATAQ